MFPWLKAEEKGTKKVTLEIPKGSPSNNQFKMKPQIKQQSLHQKSEQDNYGQMQQREEYSNSFNKSNKQRRSEGKSSVSSLQDSFGKNGIEFDKDYKHKVLDQARQEYKDFYRKNVSEYSKIQDGQNINYNEDKKVYLQLKYEQEEAEKVGSLPRENFSRRAAKTPILSKVDYGDSLRQQIEQKREIDRLQKMKQEKEDFQNKPEDIISAQNQSKRPKSILVPQNNAGDDKIQQLQQRENNNTNEVRKNNKKNVEFEGIKSEEEEEYYLHNNDRNDEDNPVFKQTGFQKNFVKEKVKDEEYMRRQQQQFEDQRRSEELNKYLEIESMNNQRYENYKNEDPNRMAEEKRENAKYLQRIELPNSMQGEQQQSKKKQETKKSENYGASSPQNKQQDIVNQLYEKEEREKLIRKSKKDQYYKQLEDEHFEKQEKKPRREENSQNREYSSSGKDKSMLEILGDNFERKEELKAIQKTDVAEQLRNQIQEKKMKEREQKEKEIYLDRQQEEKVKQDLKELKQKYEVEMTSKQHEINTLKKQHEKKRKQSLLKHSESFISNKSSKSTERQKGIESQQIMTPSKSQIHEGQIEEEPADQEMDKTAYNSQSEQNNKDQWKVTRGASHENMLVLNKQPLKRGNDSDQSPNNQDYYQEQVQQESRNRDDALEQLKEEMSIKQQPKQPYQNQNQIQLFNKRNEGYEPQMNQQQQQYQHQQQQQQQQQQYYLDGMRYNNNNNFNNNNYKNSYSNSYQSPSFINSGFYNLDQLEQNKSVFFDSTNLNNNNNINFNKQWNPPLWSVKDKRNEEQLSALKDQLNQQTNLLSSGSQKMKQDAQIASHMKSQAVVDLENLKDQLRRQNIQESSKLKELKHNLGSLGNAHNEILPVPSIFRSQGGLIMGNQKSPLQNSLSYNNSFMSPSFSTSGNNNNQKKQSYPDILDSAISPKRNSFKFEGNTFNSNPTPLDLKLQKRLMNVHLGKVDIQLLEVDNFINNLKSGI